LERIVQLVGAVVAPVTVVTALLFYFGWIRTNSLFRHFGIEAPVLRFSNQDYVLRSVEALYVPLGTLLFVGIVWTWTHNLLLEAQAAQRQPKVLQAVAAVLALAGLVCFVIGLGGIVTPQLFGKYILAAPICIGLGVATGAYGRWLWQHVRDIRVGKPQRSRWHNTLSLVLVWLLVVLSMFWATTEYAIAVGRGQAEGFARTLDRRPGVIVYSVDRLFLDAPGIVETALPPGPDANFHYRYQGLRLLTDSHGRFFLLPEGWAPGTTPTIVLDDSDRLRVEFVPGRGA
jgi:hypothetical protein